MPLMQFLFACPVALAYWGQYKHIPPAYFRPALTENALLPREMLALWNPTKVGAKQFHRASNLARKIISRGEPLD